MLRVLFSIANERFGLEAGQVEKILPLVRFTRIPGAPEFVPGMFQYRGKAVPAIDTGVLAGHGPCRAYLSTRIILVRYPDRESDCLLGLVAEQATEIRDMGEAPLLSSGIHNKATPFLGRVARDEEGLVQLLSVADLVTQEVRELLYPEGKGA